VLSQHSALRKDRTNGANAKLEHRHFAFIASVIKGLGLEGSEQRHVAKCFAAACERTNPRFDRARFLNACGTEE